jgi:hypothetical protein
LALGTIDEGPLKSGTGDHDASVSIAPGISRVRASEGSAVRVLENPFAAGNAYVSDLFDHAGSGQDAHAIRSQAKGAASLAGMLCGLEDLGTKTCLFEEKSEDRTCYTASNNKSAGWIQRHHIYLIV